jgi:hypothetical protein
MGVASDMRSQRAAEKTAIAHCRAQGGGKSCVVDMAYRDQCAVMVWGDSDGHSARAETVHRASEIALAKCGRKNANCKVYYSNCSYPVRVR